MSELLDRRVVASDAVAGWVEELRTVETRPVSRPDSGPDRGADRGQDDAALVDLLRVLEELKAAAAAAQARVTVMFDVSQRSAQRDAGVPAREVGKGIGAQVALARRDSPTRGSRHVGLAHALVEEMPGLLAALEAGVTSEWRATVAVRETACLSREDRSRVDAELAARPGGWAGLGDREVEREARRVAYRLDPFAFTERSRRAAVDRRVSIRPAPDTMAQVTGLLPAPQGVAVYAALTRHADGLRSAGDQRSRGQIMADTFVERITGQTTAAEVPVEVGLIMSDRSAFSDDAEPAELVGYGPLPAPLARDWLAGTDTNTDTGAGAEGWLRRLYADPGTGQLVATDSRRRCFDGVLRRFVVYRDRLCRTPWCGAPIRHVDHILRAAAGGKTRAGNAQGLCEACNLAKQAPGWAASPQPDGGVVTRTPTGHHYPAQPPPAVRSQAASRAGPPPSSPRPHSRLEASYADFVDLVLTA